MPYYVFPVGSSVRTVQAKGEIRDQIFNIDRDDHPLMASLPKTTVSDPNPRIVEDSLAAGSNSNAFAYNAVAPAATDTVRSLVENWAQLPMVTAEVTDYQNGVAQYGIQSELAYQKAKKLREYLRDCEWVLVSDQALQAPTSANGHLPKLRGMSAFIASNTGATFGEAALDTMLVAVGAAGGNPTQMYLTGAHKLAMEGYVTSGTVTVNMDASSQQRGAPVSSYMSPTNGVLQVIWHPWLPQDVVAAGAEVLIMQADLWELCEYAGVPLTWKPLTDTGPGPSGVWRYAFCPLCHAEQGNAMFTG